MESNDIHEFIHQIFISVIEAVLTVILSSGTQIMREDPPVVLIICIKRFRGLT